MILERIEKRDEYVLQRNIVHAINRAHIFLIISMLFRNNNQCEDRVAAEGLIINRVQKFLNLPLGRRGGLSLIYFD